MATSSLVELPELPAADLLLSAFGSVRGAFSPALRIFYFAVFAFVTALALACALSPTVRARGLLLVRSVAGFTGRVRPGREPEVAPAPGTGTRAAGKEAA
ncbi:MAG: hypothetical protein QM765_30975 [Myxococcales bacterium]